MSFLYQFYQIFKFSECQFFVRFFIADNFSLTMPYLFTMFRIAFVIQKCLFKYEMFHEFVSSLLMGHANLCIIPVLVFVLPKQAVFLFNVVTCIHRFLCGLWFLCFVVNNLFCVKHLEEELYMELKYYIYC